MPKIKSDNISAAFEMLLNEFNDEISIIQKKVQESFKIGEFSGVKEELKYAEQLSSFRKKVSSLLRRWDGFISGRRLRNKKAGGIKLPSKQLPRGIKTPSKAYYQPILKALVDLNGKANVIDVLNRVEKAMKGVLREADYEPLPSNPKDLRWVNTAKWARKDMTMMKPPLLKPDSPKKNWEITEAGRRFLLEGDR